MQTATEPETNYAKLESKARLFNDKSSEINRALAAANAKLASMQVGTEVWIGPWEDRSFQLGYGRVGKEWEILIRECEVEREAVPNWPGHYYYNAIPDTLGDPSPILQATRSQRIFALANLQDLIDELESTLDADLETIDKAIKSLDDDKE